MHVQELVNVALAALFAAALMGCSPSGGSPSQSEMDTAIREAASTLPRKIDAATTEVAIRSDGRGGLILVDTFDTSVSTFPSLGELKDKLCGVRSDSPPVGTDSPFTSLTFIYKDLHGNVLADVHFDRGECPGARL